MRNESVAQPSFYPQRFKLLADRLINQDLGIHQDDIKQDNLTNVYLHIISNIQYP